MKQLKLLLLLSFIATLRANAGSVLQTIDSANNAYSKKEYPLAVALYSKVLARGTEAPEIYFNLGNAWFKSKNVPMAILNYERAKRLKPEDEATESNLKIANAQIVDKVEEGPVHFISGWKSRFLHVFSEKTWSIICIAAFVTCLFFLLIYFVGRQVWARQISFVLSGLLLVFSVFAYYTASARYSISQTHEAGIVISPNVSAKGSPDEKGTDLFILHEGTKIFLIQNNTGWSEVKLANGNTGWLPRSSFEII